MFRFKICGHRPLLKGLGNPNLSGQLVPSTSPPNHSLRLPARMNSLKNVGEKVCTQVTAKAIDWFESNSRPATPLSMGWPTPPAVVGYSVELIWYCSEACTWSFSENRWSNRPFVYHSGELDLAAPNQFTSTTGLAEVVGRGTMLKRYFAKSVSRVEGIVLPMNGVRL